MSQPTRSRPPPSVPPKAKALPPTGPWPRPQPKARSAEPSASAEGQWPRPGPATQERYPTRVQPRTLPPKPPPHTLERRPVHEPGPVRRVPASGVPAKARTRRDHGVRPGSTGHSRDDHDASGTDDDDTGSLASPASPDSPRRARPAPWYEIQRQQQMDLQETEEILRLAERLLARARCLRDRLLKW